MVRHLIWLTALGVCCLPAISGLPAQDPPATKGAPDSAPINPRTRRSSPAHLVTVTR
jgi:hypothetical protein